MRTPTRFALDIALMTALICAYNPKWTGIPVHQWLSIAIIAPLFLHTFVNWEWAMRVMRTFVERLLSASRLNFVVDCGLMVAAVAVVLSGFMVSPELIAPLGIHPSNPLVWHLVHSWTANATIALLSVHGLLHARWLLDTAKRLAESLQPQPRLTRAQLRATAAVASAEPASALPTEHLSAIDPTASHRSRVGSRAAQAARERAAALRAAAVLGVTGALGFIVFFGVSIASPVLAHEISPASKRVAKAGLQTCPSTGCTASTCHGTTHADPNVFYGHKSKSAGAAAKLKRKTAASQRLGATLKRATTSSIAQATPMTPAPSTAAKTPTTVAAAPKTAAVTTKQAATPKRMTCPQTGCSASSCHGAHHQSASSYYN